MNAAGLHEDTRMLLTRQGTSDLTFSAIAGSLLVEFETTAAIIYTLDGGTGMLKLRCHCGLDSENVDKIRFLCLGKGMPGTAAATREPVQGGSRAESACPEEREALPEGALFVPMISEGRMRGVLGIAKNMHREFAPDEIAALAGIASLIASYLK